MNALYPALILLLIALLLLRNHRAVIARKIIQNRKQEGNRKMEELARRFVGKECLICSFDSNRQFQGIIKEVSDGAILVENAGALEAINLDFVIRIREYPRDKKGKKKSVILD